VYDLILDFASQIATSTLSKEEETPKRLATALMSLYDLIDKSVVLRLTNLSGVKEPSKLIAAHSLAHDASNLLSVMFTTYGGDIPEHVLSSIAYILGKEDVKIKVVPTPDGRVFPRRVENGLELNPPSIPNGVVKLLAIEVALDLGAPLIAIDEVENSLHVMAIHRLLDDVKDSDSILIATTHSPAIIDLVSPAEVVVMEKKGAESTAKRIPDPQHLAHKLEELGVTLSEYLTYVA